jgi:hypothetical protein
MSLKPFDTSLLTCPERYKAAPPPDFTPVQITKLDTIDAHFNQDSYQLAVGEGKSEKSPLNEREMMFLVSLDFRQMISADRQCSRERPIFGVLLSMIYLCPKLIPICTQVSHR